MTVRLKENLVFRQESRDLSNTQSWKMYGQTSKCSSVHILIFTGHHQNAAFRHFRNVLLPYSLHEFTP